MRAFRILRCWRARHPLADAVEVLQYITGPGGVGVIVRRECLCGRHHKLGYAVDHVSVR